ncbi:MAG: hypothetical protein ACI4NE_05545 [Succinivibrio sp.]
MIEIESLTEEQFDELNDRIIELFETLAQECLYDNDEAMYQRTLKIVNDSDYDMVVKVRYLTDDDECPNEVEDRDSLICGEIHFLAQDGTLKNDVHVVDIIFDPDFSEGSDLVIHWFPEE